MCAGILRSVIRELPSKSSRPRITSPSRPSPACHRRGSGRRASPRSAPPRSARARHAAAFWSAARTTLVGSITPACTRSSYFSVAALKPNAPATFLLLHDHRTLEPRIGGDPAQRLLDRTAHDPHTGALALLARATLEAVEGALCPQQRHAAAGHDALFHRSPRRVQRVFHAGLLLLHLGLGRCVHLA